MCKPYFITEPAILREYGTYWLTNYDYKKLIKFLESHGVTVLPHPTDGFTCKMVCLTKSEFSAFRASLQVGDKTDTEVGCVLKADNEKEIHDD